MAIRNFLLFLTTLAFTAGGAQELPTRLKTLPTTHGLPDLFTFDDGTPVATFADWTQRRAELIEPLLFYQYGRMPPRPDRVTARIDREIEHASGRGTEKWVTLTIGSVRKLKMRLVIYEPKTPGPHPVMIVEEGSIGGSRIAELFMTNNYLFIEYARHDLDPDKNNVVGPAQKAYPDFDWATLAVWAWGGMRVVDFLESRDDIDWKAIAITGHSRGGKMALLAGALDERFSLVAPNGSGAGGAGSSRILGPGAESIFMNDKSHWYHERLRMFGEREAHLPFDQHYLKALIAPRGLLCIESTDDLFANPVGTYATSAAARPVFEWYGKGNFNGLRFRRGGHTFSQEDWQSLLDFAEWVRRGKALPRTPGSWWQQPEIVEPHPSSGGPSAFVDVGDPGNPPDVDYPRVGAFGAVESVFQIGTYKVSNREYAAFLQDTASEADPHGLFHPRMRIRRGGRGGAWRYTAHPASANAAVTWVSWYDALRYCNWLHGGESENGAYQFSGTTRVGDREPDARYFLPTENEWYKAAYYDPAKGQYRLTPLRDAHKLSSKEMLESKSHYGMLETGDPVWEWTESKVGELFRGLRSDSWFQGNNRQARGRFYSNPDLEPGHVGFRVARRLKTAR
ncbi:MAG: SUMF1/EgtB/PvdO family nonheme iron enzyme [Verrucomicrobiota bacterium]